jgi:amidase
MTDPLGAFVPGVDVRLSGRPGGPLDGLTFAAKDLFDVQGFITGCGNPDWAATHAAAERSAAAVEALLDAGATLIGKTVTDEISLGLLGVNRFYGTPLNPRAPDRVPGGSSSGSASAVAGRACDIGLGTDSGGSVRVPASFCGLFGLRPTLGRIDARGMMVQSPTFDTVGYFTRDAEMFAKVGAVLLDEPIVPAAPPRSSSRRMHLQLRTRSCETRWRPLSVDAGRSRLSPKHPLRRATSLTGRVGNASCRGMSSARRFESGLTG